MSEGNERDRENGSRYVTWRAYHDDQAAQRKACDKQYGGLDGRLREVESVIDQQRGARTLVYFLIGSNLMVVVGITIALVGALR